MLDRMLGRIFGEMADGMFKGVLTGRFEGRGRSSSHMQHGAISALANIDCTFVLADMNMPQLSPILFVPQLSPIWPIAYELLLGLLLDQL